jgi:hypothetical protein
MANNATELVRGKIGIDGNTQVMKPKFGFPASCADVDMRRFAS